jgi:hypothetical protein
VAEVLAAEFPTVDVLVEAARELASLDCGRIEAFTPYPVAELAEVLGLEPSHVPRAAFLGGLAGGSLALSGQWFLTARSYPLDVGGRPLNSWPAFIPITFELTVLGAVLGALAAFFVSARLGRLFSAEDEIPGFESVTLDGFWLTVHAGHDVPVEELERVCRERGARRIARLEPGACA